MSRRLLRFGLTFGLALLVTLASPSSHPTTFAGTPMVTLLPSSLNFAKQAQGTSSAPQKVVLTNSGNADLVITGITVGGINASDFSHTNDCPVAPAVLPAGASCAMQVVFKPSGTGDETAGLSISDNASGSPRSVSLSGTATPPVPAVRLTPTNLNFGNQGVGTKSAEQPVTLSNTGSATLNMTRNIVISGGNSAEFALGTEKTTCPVTGGQLPPGTSCIIAVSFTPATVGAKTAQVIVMDDAEGSPHSIPLAGAGTPK